MDKAIDEFMNGLEGKAILIPLVTPVVLLFIYTVKFARFPSSSSPSYKVNPSAMKKLSYKKDSLSWGGTI